MRRTAPKRKPVSQVSVITLIICALAGFALVFAISAMPSAREVLSDPGGALAQLLQVPRDLTSSVYVPESASFFSKHFESFMIAFRTSPLLVGVLLAAAILSMIGRLGKFMLGD